MIRTAIPVLLLAAAVAFAQKDGAVPKDPILCLEPGGPTAAVTALAFAKDRTGDVLYSAGIDKVIRVWRPAAGGGFALRPEEALRIPIGPGLLGSINRMAVSPDGEFLAVTGNGVIPGTAGFAKGGEQVIDRALLTRDQRRDLYAVYVFSPARRTVTVLRGPEELVQNLAFAVVDGKVALVAQGPRLGAPGSKTMTGRGYAWDVDLADGKPRGKVRGEWDEPSLPFHEARPGLAVRLTPTGSLLTASAWGDGTFRVQEVGPTGAVTRRSVPESQAGKAQFTLPVVAIPSGWLTGGGLAGKGYIQAWGEDAAPTSKWTADLPPPAGVDYFLPTDFGLIAGGEKLDHVAALVRYPGQRYGLTLLSFAEAKISRLFLDNLFPDKRPAPPAFACSPDGRWVAVAGRDDKEIRVLAAADLVRGAVPVAALKSAGTDFSAAAFVRGPKDAGRGLLLSTRPKAAGQAPALDKTDLVLDFNTRRLAPAGDGGWTIHEPAAAGWSATLTAGGDGTWTGPAGTKAFRIQLPDGHQVTDFALCPPAAGGVPVLAVATWKATAQEPLLHLYELGSGGRVRWLNGHTRPIRSLAAAADGQFLASVADDQTTCVWDLRDLNAPGKLADVGGVRFAERDKRLVVETVDDSRKKDFQANDVLATVSIQAGARPKDVPLTSAADYKAAVWSRAPGDELTIVVLRNGVRQPVQVKLEQMADERKPLLTVFANAPERQWVAWTPAGTFDAAGPDAERYIGWQFNPAQLDGQVQYAFAEQYRDKLRDGGLLKALGGVADRVTRLPRPDLVVSHHGRPVFDIADGGAPLLLVQPKLKLNVAVPNLSIADGQLGSLTWALGDGPTTDLLAAAGPDRVADVTLPGRGDHRVTFRARTREADPQEITHVVLVRINPPAPTLKLVRPQPGRSTVRDPDATVEFEVAAADGQTAEVEVLHNNRPVKLDAGAKAVRLTLVEGENVIQVVARNAGVPEEFRERETARATAVLVYQPPNAPEIALTELLPKDAAGPVKLVAGQPTVLAMNEIELVGRITAPEPLTSLTVNGEAVAGFVADKVKETDLKVKVALKPGSNTIAVTAATKNSKPTTARLAVTYHPPLPGVEIQAPAQNDEVDGNATDRVEFRAVVSPSSTVPADHARRFELVIRVTHQGKPVPQGAASEIVLPGTDQPTTIKQSLTIKPGANLIQVRVRGTVDGPAETVGERRVTVLRKPFIQSVGQTVPNRKRQTDLTLNVRSADPLTGVLVNGRPRAFKDVPREGGRTVTVADVQLDAGTNRLAVAVVNADGRSPEATLTIAAAGRARDERRRAQIEVLVPQTTLEEPVTPVKFVVNSHEPVGDVRLLGTAAELPVWKPTPAAVEERVGVFVTEGVFPTARLADGVNDLRLVVRTTDDVEVEQPFRVTYLPRPVTLTIDSRPTGPVPDADFAVQGTVRWANPAAADRDRVLKLAVHVNGYRQPAPTEVTAIANGFTFRVPVRLRQEDNLITVDLPGTPTESAGRAEFTVSCAKPQADPQTLHLLVVAVGQDFEGKGELLAAQALKALHAQAAKEGFQSRVFSKVIVHPLRPGAAPSAVAGHVSLHLVNVRLKAIQAQAGPHDVTLLYWIGRERVEKGERYLLTSEAFDQKGVDLRRSSIPVKDLVGDAGRGGKAGAGARVILLDTLADGPVEAADDRTGRAAVLRYAWSRAGAPIPGLLTALERASMGADRTFVETLARVADRRAGEFPTRPVLEHNLDTRDGAGLGRLILTRAP